ncbi:MAG: hypothetical protein WC455_08945 [Dehalococcoidia bacterium]
MGKQITDAEFDQAVLDLATEDGMAAVARIPGVWEYLSEHYNNAAIDKALKNRNANDPEIEPSEEQPQEPTLFIAIAMEYRIEGDLQGDDLRSIASKLHRALWFDIHSEQIDRTKRFVLRHQSTNPVLKVEGYTFKKG